MLPRLLLACVVVSVASMFVAPATPAFACSCIANGTPTEAFNDADAVFAGTVTNIAVNGMSLDVSFDVSEYWKGEIGETVIVRTAAQGSMCGMEFSPGMEYLVYAFGSGVLNTGICSRTALIWQAEDDVNELNGLTDGVDVSTVPDATSDDVANVDGPARDALPIVTFVLGVVLGCLAMTFMKHVGRPSGEG